MFESLAANSRGFRKLFSILHKMIFFFLFWTHKSHKSSKKWTGEILLLYDIKASRQRIPENNNIIARLNSIFTFANGNILQDCELCSYDQSLKGHCMDDTPAHTQIYIIYFKQHILLLFQINIYVYVYCIRIWILCRTGIQKLLFCAYP